MTSKHLAIALFASLGLNVFLGGLVMGSLADGDESHHPPHHGHPPHGDGPLPAPKGEKKAKLQGIDRDGRDERGSRGGPDDLIMLRKMVRVMGGPTDPRVKKLREGSRQEMQNMRREMVEARKAVEDALAQEPFDEAALKAAMDSVREAALRAQERAQAGVVTLATVMTAEERKALRMGSGPRERDPQRGAPPDDEVGPSE